MVNPDDIAKMVTDHPDIFTIPEDKMPTHQGAILREATELDYQDAFRRLNPAARTLYQHMLKKYHESNGQQYIFEELELKTLFDQENFDSGLESLITNGFVTLYEGNIHLDRTRADSL